MTRMPAAARRRLAGERGQVSSDYAGILLIVALVVGLLMLTPFASPIRDGLDRAICVITGGKNCAQGPREPAANTCVLSSSDKSIQGSVKILIIRLEGGVKGIREERADGSVKITLEANAGAGLEFATPSVDVDAESGDDGEGSGSREVTVTANGKVARSWVFEGGTPDENRNAADDFQDTVVDKVKAMLDLNFFDDGPDLPPHQTTTVQGGVKVTAKAEARNGVGVNGNLGVALGAIFDEKTGDKTVFFELEGGAGAGASAGFFAFGGEGKGKVRLGITYDKNGKEKSAIVLGEATGSINAGLDLEGGALDKALADVSGNLDASTGGRVALNAKLDLTNPDNLRALRTFTDGADPDTGEVVPRVNGAVGLYEAFRDEGEVSIQTYGVDGENYGGGFDAAVFGVEFEYEQTNAALKDAWYLTDDGFRRWARCQPAQG